MILRTNTRRTVIPRARRAEAQVRKLSGVAEEIGPGR